jgi:hypothetical protein
MPGLALQEIVTRGRNEGLKKKREPYFYFGRILHLQSSSHGGTETERSLRPLACFPRPPPLVTITQPSYKPRKSGGALFLLGVAPLRLLSLGREMFSKPAAPQNPILLDLSAGWVQRHLLGFSARPRGCVEISQRQQMPFGC